MTIAEDSSFIGELLDTYSIDAFRMGVACVVPLEMRDGEVRSDDWDGWVQWRMLPSTLSASEVDALETEFKVQFPPVFRAYLLSRFQLFDQVASRRYDQQIFMTDTPAGKPLTPLRELLTAWRPLIDAGFIPFAQWGDGWGPMCFDVANRSDEGECPVVWIDHESLIPLSEEDCRRREAVAPLAQPLYDSCRDFLLDVFGRD